MAVLRIHKPDQEFRLKTCFGFVLQCHTDPQDAFFFGAGKEDCSVGKPAEDARPHNFVMSITALTVLTVMVEDNKRRSVIAVELIQEKNYLAHRLRVVYIFCV